MFAVFHPILTAARTWRNRLFPVDGIDLLMRLDVVGDAGLGPEDLIDLGPEGVSTALRWLAALSADGLVDLVVGGRYRLTGRGHQAVFLMARQAA